MNLDNLDMAFLLTFLAGLSTGIGSLIAFFIKDHKNMRYLSLAMGLAAGVMIYVSFMEILPEAIESLEKLERAEHLAAGAAEDEHSHWPEMLATLAFFGGMGLVALIDKLVPKADNPHELLEEEKLEELDEKAFEEKKKPKRLMRVGLLTAFALALHNFPEGIATFVATLDNLELGITIAVAIAMHNIPEGIAVSMPIYYATGSRKQAFFYSFLSGLVEPLGAFVAYLFLMPYLTPLVMGLLLAGVAGIMIFIALDQLLPAAQEYGEHHLTTYGLILGMALMAVSMLLLGEHHAH